MIDIGQKKELCFPNPLSNNDSVTINDIYIGNISSVEHRIYPNNPNQEARSTIIVNIDGYLFFKDERITKSLDEILEFDRVEIIQPKK